MNISLNAPVRPLLPRMSLLSLLSMLVALLMLTLAPGLSQAQEARKDYVLGSGDVIRINVYQNPDLTLETRVTEAGIQLLAATRQRQQAARSAHEDLVARVARCLAAHSPPSASSAATISPTGCSPRASTPRTSRRAGSAMALKTSDVVAAREMGPSYADMGMRQGFTVGSGQSRTRARAIRAPTPRQPHSPRALATPG